MRHFSMKTHFTQKSIRNQEIATNYANSSFTWWWEIVQVLQENNRLQKQSLFQEHTVILNLA